MSAFIGDLDVRLVDGLANSGRGDWEHLSRFGYQSDYAKCTIWCEVGEHTDFASVPRLPLIWLMEGDKGRKAAAIHDHLYRTEELDRETSDEVLREALLVEGYSQEDADAFYFGVRIGGGAHYGHGSPVAIAFGSSSAGGQGSSA